LVLSLIEDPELTCILWPIDLNSFLQDYISSHSDEPVLIFGAAFFIASFIGEELSTLEIIRPAPPPEVTMLEDAPPPPEAVMPEDAPPPPEAIMLEDAPPPPEAVMPEDAPPPPEAIMLEDAPPP
jgi:hypothetical protein